MYSFCLLSSTIHWLKTWQIHDRLPYTSSTSASNHQQHHPWSSQENLLYHCHTLHCKHCGNINTSWSITQLTQIRRPWCSETSSPAGHKAVQHDCRCIGWTQVVIEKTNTSVVSTELHSRPEIKVGIKLSAFILSHFPVWCTWKQKANWDLGQL